MLELNAKEAADGDCVYQLIVQLMADLNSGKTGYHGTSQELLELIELHKEFTGSKVAERVLEAWPQVLGQFIKVMPTDYKRVLAERRRHDEEMEAAIHEDPTVNTAVLGG